MVQTSEARLVSALYANSVSASRSATRNAVSARLFGTRALIPPAACRGPASSPLGGKTCILRTNGVVNYRGVFSRHSDRRRILLFSPAPLIREFRPIAKQSLLPDIDCRDLAQSP